MVRRSALPLHGTNRVHLGMVMTMYLLYLAAFSLLPGHLLTLTWLQSKDHYGGGGGC